MTDVEQEKIATFRKNIAESLRILDEIVEIIRFQDNPEDTVIDQKLEENQKNIISIAHVFRIVKFII